jgi:hypothetical protein
MKKEFYEEDISSVEINWQDGYKRITVYLKNGDEYTVESDN